MAKYCLPAVVDLALDEIATATRLFVCSAQPSSYADAATVVDLATHIMEAGDFAQAAGDSGGDSRKTTVAAQAGITIDHGAPTDATHVALGRAADSVLLYVTTCDAQALTAGGTVDVPAWDIEFPDPT